MAAEVVLFAVSNSVKIPVCRVDLSDEFKDLPVDLDSAYVLFKWIKDKFRLKGSIKVYMLWWRGRMFVFIPRGEEVLKVELPLYFEGGK